MKKKYLKPEALFVYIDIDPTLQTALSDVKVDSAGGGVSAPDIPLGGDDGDYNDDDEVDIN